MNDFDRFLELELARMLDRVVTTPAPPRSSPPGRRPVVRLFNASASAIAPAGTVGVVADGPADQRAELAFAEPASTPGAAAFS